MTMTMTMTVDPRVQQIIRLLDEFALSRNLHTISAARTAITDLVSTEGMLEITMPLWNIALTLQRNLTDLGDGE